MKQVITLCCLLVALQLTRPAHSQVVLNEIYTDPGSGNHEFFELYNTSTSTTPVSMDDYTIVSFFENGTEEKGFYVLDLPNFRVQPKGYFVGAAQMPFNYQGRQNSTAANFTWNDPALPQQYGYLKKWVLTGAKNVPDENKVYAEGTVPAGLNDLFHKRTGNSATYSTLVYRNGKLVNAFFGGTGGASSVPDFITHMPPLTVDLITASETKKFTINFKSYTTIPPEAVIENAGSDNGYIRKKDGLCNQWNKSSANTFHTPGASNGGAVGEAGSLTIGTHIAVSSTTEGASFVNYNITNGPSHLFPVNLQVYLDNGVTAGQLDSADTFVEQNTENLVTDGPFTTYYKPAWQDILMVAETNIGCLDQVLHLTAPPESRLTVLPINLLSFEAEKEKDHIAVSWTAAANEMAKNCEVQKSYDGRNFITAGTVVSTKKTGKEAYVFNDAKTAAEKVFYRLRLQHLDGLVTYSKTTMIHTEGGAPRLQILLQSPVRDAVSLVITSGDEPNNELAIYNMNGLKMYTETIQLVKGKNYFTIPLSARFRQGHYVVTLSNTHAISTKRFIKQ